MYFRKPTNQLAQRMGVIDEESSMKWVRLTVLGCLALTGCNMPLPGLKETPNSAKLQVGKSSAPETPTYPWSRPPEDWPRPSLLPTKPGESDSF